MSIVKCPKCGSFNNICKKKYEFTSGDLNTTGLICAQIDVIKLILETIKSITVFGKILLDRNEMYLVCKDCGYIGKVFN